MKTKKNKTARRNKSAQKKTAGQKSTELELVNFKATGKDRRKIAAKAKKHAGGNLSAWLRYAATHFEPEDGVVIR